MDALRARGLWGTPQPPTSETKYEYRDEHGQLLALHGRKVTGKTKKNGKQEKVCLWYTPTGTLSKNSAVQPSNLPLYRLPELLEADPAKPVILVEGEPCVETLRRLGYAATTLAGGAEHRVTADTLEPLTRFNRIILWPDNDQPGRALMERAGRALADQPGVYWLDVPGLPEHGDVVDYIRSGHGTADLNLLFEAATPFADHLPSSNSAEQAGDKPFALTDLGNAERLIDRYGKDIRYCAQQGGWLIWDGRRWTTDKYRKIEAYARDTVRQIGAEATDEPDEKRRREILQHALRSESAHSLKAMVELARSFVSITAEELDRSPKLLNVLNGTIDLRTGQLHPHDRNQLITKLAPVEYDPEAHAPEFDAFLKTIFGGDQETIHFVQRASGYTLAGTPTERVMLILYGTGRNGKSTLVNTIRHVIGDYSHVTPTKTLLHRDTSSVNNDVAALKGARFVSASEVSQGRRLAEADVKQLTGNDPVTARFLHAEFFTFQPECVIWLSTNHRPEIKGTDEAIWDRLRLIPFDVRIPDDQVDKDLASKLQQEAAGILSWMVEGCREWQQNGLNPPQRVRAATAGYRADMDVLQAFIDESCVVNPEVRVTAPALYEAYQSWMKSQGEESIPQREFGRALSERGFTRRKANSANNWLGIGLRASTLDPISTQESVFLTHESDNANFYQNQGTKGSRVLNGHVNGDDPATHQAMLTAAPQPMDDADGF